MKKTDGKTTLKHVQALAKTGTKLKTAAARRAEELLALIARRKENIVDAFYDVGQALQEMLDNKLHMALGYDNFEAMIAARNVIGRSQAFKLIAVVKQLPRAEAIAMGQERAYALANLAAATPQHDTATSIVTKGVRVRGTVRDVSRLSVREIESLAKQVRPRKKKTSASIDADREANRIGKLLKARDHTATLALTHHKTYSSATIHIRLDALTALLG